MSGDRLSAGLLGLGGAAAVAGCLLPWERLRFSGVGLAEQTSVLSVFHGSGFAALAGTVLALACVAHRLIHPASLALRDALCAGAGALLVAGAALFTTSGGYRPASGPGYSVSLGPGLILMGAGGVGLVAAAFVAARSATNVAPATSRPA